MTIKNNRRRRSGIVCELVIAELFSSFDHTIYKQLYTESISYKVDATTDNTADDSDNDTPTDDMDDNN